MSATVPIPPPQLVARIGGTCDDYAAIGLGQRRTLERLLGSDWSFAGKSVLDFGCGTGRTLSAFLHDAGTTEFFGCDIHAESIAWANSELNPPLQFFSCAQAPPLPQPAQRFDLVYAMSVFTHITDQWSHWLTELHRVLRPGGLAVISVLGPTSAKEVLNIPWDERIGMAVIDLDKGWEVGGPSVLLAEWWIREHWGRAFEILSFEPCDPSFRQDFCVMCKRESREQPISPEQLEAADPRDQREYESIVCNLEMLERQQRTLAERMVEADRGQIAAELEAERLLQSGRELETELAKLEQELSDSQPELEQLQRLTHVLTTSHSWRFTAPLRRARAIGLRTRQTIRSRADQR